ncbi:MAG: helix-turn-helix transcriptional regulator [Defluviitaleaceae bacterium]|nr:helix-turn-helix transcriptional regulator [Defluviitaleaceae bacterium]
MPSYDVGELIKRIRKQKGISQEDLAYPIIDRSTLSKIESGKAAPHRKTLEYLLERLGFDTREFISHFLVPDDIKVEQILDELHLALRVVLREINTSDKDEKFNQIGKLIQQLESNTEFVSHALNKQLLLDFKARYAFNIKDDETASRLAREALLISIPNFNENNIPNYYLNKCCGRMLNLLSMIYKEAKDYDAAINIAKGLLANQKNTFKEESVFIKSAAPIYTSLAMALVLANRPEEAIEICEEGIIMCSKTLEYAFCASLTWWQAKSLYLLGKKDEYINLSRKVYYTYDVLRSHWNRDYVRDNVLNDTGVDISIAAKTH